MDPVVYIVGGIVLGGVFFATAIYAFSWASRDGQMRDFDRGATVIFDEDEPLGKQTDFFPNRRKGARKAPRPSPEPRT